jgi:hypothetical protein
MERMMMRAMATYEKQQGREIDAVEQHVFRTAYAMGVQDQQSETAIAAANTRDAMRPALDLLHEYMDSVGGCDHSVGICQCGEYAVLGDAAKAVGWVPPNVGAERRP